MKKYKVKFKNGESEIKTASSCEEKDGVWLLFNDSKHSDRGLFYLKAGVESVEETEPPKRVIPRMLP